MNAIPQFLHSAVSKFIGTILRKVLFGAALAPVIAWLVAQGIVTIPKIEGWIDWAAVAIVAIGAALWTAFILPWLKKLLNKGNATQSDDLPVPPPSV